MQKANALKRNTTKKAFENAIKAEEEKNVFLDLSPTAEVEDFSSGINKINHGIQSSHTMNVKQIINEHTLDNESAYHQ